MIPSLPSGRIVLMFLLFALLFGTGQFHRVSISVLAPELTAELFLGTPALGGISAIYFLCGALMQIPIGMCLDRFGTRRTVPVLLAIASSGTYLFATADTIHGLMAGRALMGMGFASSMIAAFIVFSRWVPPENSPPLRPASSPWAVLGVCSPPTPWPLQSIGMAGACPSWRSA